MNSTVNTPCWEFSPSALVTHEGTPALLQGRLYSFLKDMGVETASLFRAGSQWIKRSFEPCPYKLLGGVESPEGMLAGSKVRYHPNPKQCTS